MTTVAEKVGEMRELWDRQSQKSKFGYISHLSAGSWDAKEFHWAGVRFVDRMADRFADYADVEASFASVLEIGCGVGRFLKPLACRFQHVTGVDISPQMLEVAKEYCAGLPNIALGLNDGYTLKEFDDGAFDYCVSAGVFHHITHIDVILNYVREALRVLKPGGLVLFQFEGTRTEAQGSGSLGARITARDLTEGLASCAYRIREISWDPADAVRNIVIVLQKTAEPSADAERRFEEFPLAERRWIRGVYDGIKTKVQMHARQQEAPKRVTFYD